MELITHREKTSAANDSKSDYLQSIESFIAKRQSRLNDARKSREAEIILHPDESRKSFIDMLGYPLTEEAHMPISAVKTLIASERDIDIYRVKLEIFEDFCFYGLFFQIRNKRLPLVVVQHGGLGTPELCSGFFESGSSNYNDMTERILHKGVDIFMTMTSRQRSLPHICRVLWRFRVSEIEVSDLEAIKLVV